MTLFLNWLNKDDGEDLILKAGIAHLWFVTLHPFDDGNGRITRAITDMLLTRSDNNEKRFYSMSAQIQKTKKSYYDILENTQKGPLDITPWLEWFLNCLLESIKASEIMLAGIFAKHAVLQRVTEHKLNARQREIIDKMFDNFKGNLTSSKWAKLTKTSQDTANRDIAELVSLKILKKVGDGRNTHYVLVQKTANIG
jgi:Fic family protein